MRLTNSTVSLSKESPVITLDSPTPYQIKKLALLDTWYGDDEQEYIRDLDFESNVVWLTTIKVTGTFNDDGSPRIAEYYYYHAANLSADNTVINKINELFANSSNVK